MAGANLGGSWFSAPSATIATDGVVRVYGLGADFTLWQAWYSGGAWASHRIWGTHTFDSSPAAVYDPILNEHWIFIDAYFGGDTLRFLGTS